jgi:hypothetical protein
MCSYLASGTGMNVQKNNANKERQDVENYVRLYCLEEILDEVMNHIILTLPQDPFLEISKFIQRKTLPEIMKVTVSSIIIGSGNFGICVEVTSNIGSFTGQMILTYRSSSSRLRRENSDPI